MALAMLATRPSMVQTPAPAPAANQTNLGNDANGNPLRRALKTGHVSNYDESKVPPYTLPDPLVMASGTRVTSANMWKRQRRPELLRAYEAHIYGRVPANAPKITWEVAETDTARARRCGAAETGDRPRRLEVRWSADSRVGLYAGAGDEEGPDHPAHELRWWAGASGAPPAAAARRPGRPGRGNAATGEPPNAADILARGWGYATVGYNDIQPDRADAWTEGVIGQTLAPGQTKPAPGRVGHDQRLGVGRQSHCRLSAVGSERGWIAHRALRLLAAGQDRAVGGRAGRAVQGRVLGMCRRDGLGARPPRLG